MRPLLILAVLALDWWAIASVLASRHRRAARALWIAAIVGLPVAGAVAWLARRTTAR